MKTYVNVVVEVTEKVENYMLVHGQERSVITSNVSDDVQNCLLGENYSIVSCEVVEFKANEGDDE